MAEEVKGIYKKIEQVWNDLTHIVKDQQVKYGDVNYKGTKEETVIALIRPALLKQHLIVLPVRVHSVTVVGKITTAAFEYEVIDCDTGEKQPLASIGSGHDSADKGAGKAYTYATKNALIKLCLLIQGDDPDKTSSAELADKDKKNALDQGKGKISQMLEDNPGLTEDYRDGIVQDVDEAFGKKDVDTMRIIYREVETEVRKHGLREAKERNEEPPLPSGKPAHSSLDDPEQAELIKASQGDRDIF